MYDKKLRLLHINPGAVGKEGFQQKRTMIRFNLNSTIDKQGKVSKLEIIEFGGK